jgi:hypothetical protein
MKMAVIIGFLQMSFGLFHFKSPITFIRLNFTRDKSDSFQRKTDFPDQFPPAGDFHVFYFWLHDYPNHIKMEPSMEFLCAQYYQDHDRNGHEIGNCSMVYFNIFL